MNVLLPLLIALSAAPLVALFGALRPAWAARLSAGLAGLAFAATLWGWLSGGGGIDYPWAPSWGLRLSFRLDGLAALYALLATGIGLLVCIYSSRYLPSHLEHAGRSAQEGVRFYAFLMLFMGAMVGLAMAQDLVLLFLFWDATAISSYFLIGYDRHDPESRRAALMALLVTGVSAVLFLVGALALYDSYDTFALPELITEANPSALVAVSAGLMAAAALAKSAQVPFHFWLPRAMAAPTPVSAYLHSAAMVAAGVFLLERIYPLLQMSAALGQALLVVGALSMLVGSLLALMSEAFKRVLAYSTVAQYGYVVFMLGLGGEAGIAGASLYVVAHALVKSALFMTAGAVTEATGEDRLGRVGGLWRSTPALAVGSGLAAAGLSGLPLTVGFFKDELLFAAALGRSPALAALAALAAAMTLAYTWRFWGGIFLGRPGKRPGSIPAGLIFPVVVLGLAATVFGVWSGPIERLAEAAGSVAAGEPTPIEAAYHLDLRAENLLALSAWGLGAALLAARSLWAQAVRSLARLGARAGPEAGYESGLASLERLSAWVYQLELHELANRVATILIPTAILLLAGLLATPSINAFRFGEIRPQDLPLLLAAVLVAVAGLAMALPRGPLTQAMALSSVGFSLMAVFGLFGAPDVALVAALVGIVSTIFFVAIYVLFPREMLESGVARTTSEWQQRRDIAVGVVTGFFAFIVAWGVFSQPASRESIVNTHIALTPAVHAGDIVTAILADFRGLDTLGEITVVVISLVGLATLLQAGKLK